MPLVTKRFLKFAPSASPDVTGYKLRFGATPYTPSYADTALDLGLPPVTDGKCVVELTALPEVAALAEGVYDFAVTAVDDVGNESAFVEAENVPFDVEVPEPVTDLEVV